MQVEAFEMTPSRPAAPVQTTRELSFTPSNAPAVASGALRPPSNEAKNGQGTLAVLSTEHDTTTFL